MGGVRCQAQAAIILSDICEPHDRPVNTRDYAWFTDVRERLSAGSKSVNPPAKRKKWPGIDIPIFGPESLGGRAKSAPGAAMPQPGCRRTAKA